MTDENETRYQEEMDWLEAQMRGVDDALAMVNERILNGAVMTAPRPFVDPALSQRHKQLTEQADRIIDRMQAIHCTFTSETPPGAGGK